MSLYGFSKRMLDLPDNPNPVMPNNSPNPPLTDPSIRLQPVFSPIILRGWQNDLYRNIVNRRDSFVSVPPSAGKTLPVLTAWFNLFEGYLNGTHQSAPYILYVVPRKQLAGQISTNDFLRDGRNGLAQYLYNQISLNNPLFAFLTKKSDVDRFIDGIIAELTGGGGSTDPTYPPFMTANFNHFNTIKPVIVATYEIAAKIMETHSNIITHVFVDEVQELIPHPNEFSVTEDVKTRFLSLVKILKRSTPQTSITLMTGSVNYQTVNQLIGLFNNKAKRHFIVVPNYSPNSPPVLNRSKINLQVLSSLNGQPTQAYPARLKLCKDIILNRQHNSIMIIFSKQRTGMGIFRLIEDLISTLPPTNNEFFYDSKSDINNAKLRHLKNILDGRVIKSRNIDDDDFRFLLWFDINDIFSKNPNNSNNSKSNPDPDPNNVLYQGVLRGVAPLIGDMHQRHKKIVQTLFIKRKISLLLATDALGVGANVECRDLYIPTIDKFDGKRLSPTDESSLTQLIHRAGRGKFDTANVYCSVQDYDYIHSLIFNDPRSQIPKLSDYVMKQLESLLDSN